MDINVEDMFKHLRIGGILQLRSMKVTIITVVLVLCSIHGRATPILLSDPGQPSNAGDDTIQTWLISKNLYDTTHDPDLSTDSVGAHPDTKVAVADLTAPLGYPMFPTGTLSITLPGGLNDYLVLHWGGPGGGFNLTFDLATTPEELDTFTAPGQNALSRPMLLLGFGLLVLALWGWRMKFKSRMKSKSAHGLIPPQLDLFNTADRLTAHPADLVRMGEVLNFQKVSDDLYRSGQPTAQGLKDLKSLGIRTVVNLRSFHSNAQETRNAGLDYEQIRVKDWYPKEKQLIKFLRFVTDHRKTPVLVHCQYGRHRTGTICAVYRIAVQGWTRERALAEMIEGGFGFHGMLDGNTVQWINNLNIAKIKRKAGIIESDTVNYARARHLNILSS